MHCYTHVHFSWVLSHSIQLRRNPKISTQLSANRRQNGPGTGRLFLASLGSKSTLQTIHQTDNWIAVNKPAGLLMHRTKLYHSDPHEEYLVDLVATHVRNTCGEPVQVYPVQRLDRPTSGVVIFALGSSRNAAQLQNVLQQDDVCKQYWTIVSGADMPVSWTNEHPLRDLTGKNRKQRPAKSHFMQLLRLDESNVSVVRAEISTGRRHQIRRHLSNSRYPVLGDTSHGKGEINRRARELYGVERCCLHSRRLSFKDPWHMTKVTLEAAVPNDLRQVLERFPDYDSEKQDSLFDLGDLSGCSYHETSTAVLRRTEV